MRRTMQCGPLTVTIEGPDELLLDRATVGVTHTPYETIGGLTEEERATFAQAMGGVATAEPIQPGDGSLRWVGQRGHDGNTMLYVSAGVPNGHEHFGSDEMVAWASAQAEARGVSA